MRGVAVITAFCRPLQFICASVIYPARNPTTKKTTAVSIVSFFIQFPYPHNGNDGSLIEPQDSVKQSRRATWEWVAQTCFLGLRLFGSYGNSRHNRDLLAVSFALRPWTGLDPGRAKAADLKNRSALRTSARQ
jgi:hypothetical protein